MAVAAREAVQDQVSTAAVDRARVPAAPTSASPAAGNRALARVLTEAAASRTLARCPGCGGRCGGSCGGHRRREPDEELMASGQKALRRAVTARRG